MKNRIIATILILTMVLSFITACGNKTKQVETKQIESKIFAEGILNEDNLSLSKDGVGIELDLVNLPVEESKVVIRQVLDAPPLDDEEDTELLVYDFELEGINSFEGVIDLIIPLNIGENGKPGAAWLNEETQKWEPVSFTYDEIRKSVIISTDHLSKYAVFNVTNEGTRRAKLEFLGLNGDGDASDYMAAINEYASAGATSTECLDIGIGAASDALQMGGDILGGIVQTGGYMAYGTNIVDALSDSLGNLGLLFSIVQVSSKIYNGNTEEAVVGSMKIAYTYILGKVANKLSSSVMSASMAAIAIVDYSINKFGTTALEMRADLYKDAYNAYYHKSNDGYKSSVDWYNILYPLLKDHSLSETELKAKIDKIVRDHCDEFWADESTVALYVDKVRKNTTFTGGGGLNSKIKKDLSAEKRFILYDQVLPGVFRQIAKHINIENEKRLRDSYKELSDYLNKTIKFNVKDKDKQYAKHLAKIAPLNNKAIVSNWTGKFNDEGTLSTSFTLYGHITSGSPNKLLIFEPDANIDTDKPIREVEFTINGPSVEIDLSEEVPTVDEINGLWSSCSTTITDYDIGPPPDDSTNKNDEEGCDFSLEMYNQLKERLEADKGKPTPMKMELQLDEAGIGFMQIVMIDDEEEDNDGDQPLNATYKDGSIKANLSEGAEGYSFTGNIKKMNGKIVLKGEFRIDYKKDFWIIGNWNGEK